MRDKIQAVFLTVYLANFRILGVAGDGFGLKYKTRKMAAHIFRTEVKNEWGYSSILSVCLLGMDRDGDNFAFCLLQYNVFCSFVRVQRLLCGFN